MGYDNLQIGRMTMRHLVNFLNGYRNHQNETWRQARMIAWFSAFDRKPFRETDIPIPGEYSRKAKGNTSQSDKEARYKLLEKWNK